MKMPIYIASEGNIHIVNSYEITSKSEMRTALVIIRSRAKKQGYQYKRSLESWVNEWYSHNLLYKRGVMPEQTSSVDLNDDASWFIRACYWIISKLHME